MLRRVSRIILSLLVISYNRCTIVETLLSKDDEKLSENTALRMCIDGFDIYKDKIIRTQDSQGMGAKYLNEVDLDSRQECLRLCCETDECDVFIFEEKKPGSCYLFHCGQPHDFKCKFTSHANYSSAVLMNDNYRSTAQLEEQIRRTQQEHELKSLRKLSEPASLEYAYTEAPSFPITQAPKNVAVATPAPTKAACSRNQYECKTSGDCIAIYNVCDGVPQCTDGSDEASELGCPTERPTLPSAPVVPHEPMIQHAPHVLNKYPPDLPHRKNYPPIYTSERDNLQKVWQSPMHQANPQQQTNPQYPGPQSFLPVPQYNYGSPGYNVAGWDYRQMYEQNKEAYNMPNQLHQQNESPNYEQDQPRIFKHKSPSVIVESAIPQGNSYIDTNRPYGSYYPSQNHAAWQEGQPKMPSQQAEPPEVTISPKLQQNPPTAIQESPKTTTGPIPCKPALEEANESSKKEKKMEENKHESLKTIGLEKSMSSNHDVKPEKPAEKPKVESKIETKDHEKHEKSHEEDKPEVRKHHYIAEHLQQNNHKADNSDILRPKGAVISLALGLTATAIMAALIACRLRVVRRRGRRGHGPYAHDADYLVNGMYL